jgi:hypothetical protein
MQKKNFPAFYSGVNQRIRRMKNNIKLKDLIEYFCYEIVIIKCTQVFYSKIFSFHFDSLKFFFNKKFQQILFTFSN